MRKIKLYIASSLDGFIARPDGDVSWLHAIPNPDETDHGYAEFYESIDTTLMGNNTYRQVLGFGIDFPYKDKSNFVFTRDKQLKKDENVEFISDNIIGFLTDLKLKNGKDIWLIGGGELNTLLLNNDLIDELIVFIMPIILGEGLPLFSGLVNENKLTLLQTKKYNSGAIELQYSLLNE